MKKSRYIFALVLLFILFGNKVFASILFQVTQVESGLGIAEITMTNGWKWRSDGVSGSINYVCVFVGSNSTTGTGDFKLHAYTADDWPTYTNLTDEVISDTKTILWTAGGSDASSFTEKCFHFSTAITPNGSSFHVFRWEIVTTSAALSYNLGNENSYPSLDTVATNTYLNGASWFGYSPAYVLSYGDPQDTSTRFDSISVATSTGTVNVTGYWNATTTEGIYEQIHFYQYDDIFGQQSFVTQTATTTGDFNWTFQYVDPPTSVGTTTADFGVDTTFHAKIYQYDNAYWNDPFSGITDPLYKILLAATSTSMTPSELFYDITSPTDLFAYPEYECSITSLTGCFKNALIWTFYPTRETIESYYDFISLIQSKPPIGYFTVVKNSIGGLSSTSTPAFSVTIPYSLKHYIFDPMDMGIASILWFFFIFNFYKRLKLITI